MGSVRVPVKDLLSGEESNGFSTDRGDKAMADGFIHTLYKNGEWINEVEGGSAFGGSHATKEDAVAAGRARAKADETEHVIRNQDGTISERNSYGGDPASRPG
jgi:hypothetical protein